MKRLLSFLIVGIIAICASAQTISFKTTAFSYKERTSYGWTSWSNWQSDNSLMTIDLTNDMIVIYTKTTQYYNIIGVGRNYRDGDAEVQEFYFIDQDGDQGTLRLAMRTSGRSEVYVAFNNVMWGYIVRRL